MDVSMQDIQTKKMQAITRLSSESNNKSMIVLYERASERGREGKTMRVLFFHELDKGHTLTDSHNTQCTRMKHENNTNLNRHAQINSDSNIVCKTREITKHDKL